MTAEHSRVLHEPKINTWYTGKVKSKDDEIIEVKAFNPLSQDKSEEIKITLNPKIKPTPLYDFLSKHISKEIRFIFLERRATQDPNIVSLHVDIIEENGETISRDYEKFRYSFIA
jgi:hypothetical protein